MSKDIETLDNNKARACEVWALRIKKGCASILTQPLLLYTVGVTVISV